MQQHPQQLQLLTEPKGLRPLVMTRPTRLLQLREPTQVSYLPISPSLLSDPPTSITEKMSAESAYHPLSSNYVLLPTLLHLPKNFIVVVIFVTSQPLFQSIPVSTSLAEINVNAPLPFLLLQKHNIDCLQWDYQHKCNTALRFSRIKLHCYLFLKFNLKQFCQAKTTSILIGVFLRSTFYNISKYLQSFYITHKCQQW